MKLEEKLKSEIETCSWDLLDKNLERDAVFLIAENVDLVEAAVAVAKDETEKVAEWIQKQEIKKMSPLDAPEYQNSQFKFIIVQPFVLAKLIVS